MVNNVIGVVNYVIAARPSLRNFMIADRHPDFVLAAAVARGILTPAQAHLIGRNRLEGIPLAQIAGETGISHSALCNRRKRAEKAITEAIRGGSLSDS